MLKQLTQAGHRRSHTTRSERCTTRRKGLSRDGPSDGLPLAVLRLRNTKRYNVHEQAPNTIQTVVDTEIDGDHKHRRILVTGGE